MAYFEFLAGFIGIPALFVTMLNSTLHWKGTMLPRSLRAWPSPPVVGGHLLLALLYTTPWDNYLVATSVWWYDPALVVGTTLGYVPVEEYLFFIGQTFLVGTAFLAAARLLPPFDRPFLSRPHLRLWSTCLAMSTWMYGIFLLGSGKVSGTYLGLELAWGLIPLSFQLGFGADIIWHYRRPVVWTLVPATAYLSLADAFAIQSGTWTISAEQSLGIAVGGILPLEEFIFFFMTSTMVVFGVTLFIAKPSHERARWIPGKLRNPT